MNRHPIVPCLWFDDEAERAASFYAETFPDGRVHAVSHYPQSGDNPSGKPPGSVLTVDFEVAGQRFTALNGGPMFVKNPSISFFVRVETARAADRLYAKLVEGGEPLMPIDSYPWSERYGWIKDAFGVSWQVMATRRSTGEAIVVPCLMFAGPQQGRAQTAVEAYTRAFPDSRTLGLERYAPGEGPEESVKHGRFVVAGQEMIAMDSHIEHGITFNEGISLQVMCSDQAEVDRYWTTLSDGGEPGPCGWLKDRFGLSWQIVPDRIVDWMSSKDLPARDRAFAALMKMGKPDIAALEAAFQGRLKSV